MNTDPKTLVLSLLQTAATLQNHGFSEEETRKRLMEEIGIAEDNAAQVVSALPDFFRKTDGTGRVAGPPKVFISHSHYDREAASLLQIVLEQNKVLTFLDQHQIVVGQDLNTRLMAGLIGCDQLLLLCSAHTGQSEFVGWEWQRALRLMKPILPYVLDETPLPNQPRAAVRSPRFLHHKNPDDWHVDV